MPRYISLHVLGCLPKPAFAALCNKLFSDSESTRRIVAGQVAGKMLVEFEAADGDDAETWLRTRRLQPSWIMRVDYESTDGSLHEL